ncbi:unnamed protein product [Aphanomyces euteiches]
MEALPGETFRHVVSFLECVNAPNSPVWKDHFCRRWARHNFVMDSNLPCKLTLHLLGQCKTESACYRYLTHVVHQLPSYANIEHTHKAACHFEHHRFRAIQHNAGEIDSPLTISFEGGALGGDRCVRSNAPFSITPHAFVLRIREEGGQEAYQIGVSTSGYFEITIENLEISNPPTEENQRHRPRRFGYVNDCVAIGIADRSFRVIGNQPGWRGTSYGYHGDDGHAFHRTSRGVPHGERFGPGDTVGCALVNQGATIVFTRNGVIAGPVIPCSEGCPLYPIVGIDTPHVIRWNFGQMPFVYAAHNLFGADGFDLYEKSEWEGESVHDNQDSDSDDSEDDDESIEMGYYFANEFGDDDFMMDEEFLDETEYDPLHDEEYEDVEDDDSDEDEENVYNEEDEDSMDVSTPQT